MRRLLARLTGRRPPVAAGAGPRGAAHPAVLIVTHQLSLSGAPVMMVSYARWLVEHHHEVQVLALRDGPLADAVRAVAPLSLAPHWVTGWHHLPNERVRRRLQGIAWRRWIRRRFTDVDVVHANTLTCGYVAQAFAQCGFPVVSHIHELESVARNIPLAARHAQVDSSLAIVCVSNAVRDYIARSLQLDAARMQVVPSMADVTPRRHLPRSTGPDREFTIGACGSLHWRKGSDLFLLVAHDLIVRRGARDVRFVWLGGDHGSEEAMQRADDLHRLGIGDRVHFAPEIDDPAGSGWYETLDAFVLTSREDPFPLVIHEAAAAALPMVAFAGCGGFDEFAAEGEAGTTVPFGDCAQLSGVLEGWMADRDAAAALGERARAKWETQYEPGETAARLWAIDRAAAQRP